MLWPLLPLAGIPLLIHWLSRRYPKKFAFSSIDEIRRTLAGRSRVFRWRHLLMLLLRTARACRAAAGVSQTGDRHAADAGGDATAR